MHKVRIRLPAALTNLGPGLDSIGLALRLYTTVEISEREDTELVVETEGEGAGHYAVGLRHPVVMGMVRMFQKLERAPLGITVRATNEIPLQSGLGAEMAFIVAGVIGANNLMGTPFTRPEVLTLAAAATGRVDAATPVLGGLVTGALDGDKLLYRTLPVTPFKVIVVVPEVKPYSAPALPERIPRDDVRHDYNRLPLLIDALQEGDIDLLARVIQDRMYTPLVKRHITGFAHVEEVARLAGAQAVTTSGAGPALVIFTEQDHQRIAEAVETAFDNLDVPARTWVVPFDTQGIVLSVMQSA